MKAVIFGGTGFVGSNLSTYFRDLGYRVIAADNLYKTIGGVENKTRLEQAGIDFQYLDIRNANDVEEFFRKNQDTDLFINVAAQVAFKRSIENPRLDFEINAQGTFNILEGLRLFAQGAKFIYASTNQVYGALPGEGLVEQEKRFDFKDLVFGIPETYPMDFLSPYGCSKGAADLYTLDYARVFGLKTAVARLGGIYGDWQYSYEDHGWVAYMTKMVACNLEFNRYGHGKQVRDVLYVSDICRAFELIANNMDKIAGEALNIAGGPKNTLSVLELLELLEGITGNKERSIVNPMRQADKLVAYLDIRKAEKLIDWKPEITPQAGIEKLVRWTRSISLDPKAGSGATR